VGRKLILNSGDLVRFWLDPWMDNAPLKSMFPQLYDIFQAQNWTFLRVKNNNFILPFRKRLTPVLLE
jgi:hypothetical protein